MRYKEYINSPSWNDLCKSFLQENPICNICNKFIAEEVHHKTYENFGNETFDDLEGLCSRCHFGLHDFQPYIIDLVQRNKAIKIMNYFKLYPSIKTLVLNDVSRIYFNSEFMLDVSKKESDNTPMFNQNLMEIFDKRGREMNQDIIEYALSRCIKYRMDAGKNSYLKSQAKLNKSKSDLCDVVIPSYKQRKELTHEEKELVKVTRFCLGVLNDREALKSAKSYFNKKFYGGNVIFNNIGAKTPANFIVKLKKDNLLSELYDYLGGNEDEF